MLKRTKILATIGPASDSVEMLEKLIRAGVNVFRMNFSHGDHVYHTQVLENIRSAMNKTGLLVGVLQDISGPKIRIGELAEPFELQEGDRLEFVKEPMVGEKVAEGEYRLSINQSEILERLCVDEAIYLYDGRIRVKVTDVGNSVTAVVQNSGLLTSRKGLNFPHTRLGLDVLTPKDRKDIEWGVRHGIDFMAISFVQNAEDMRRARELVHSLGGSQQLYAKIEKFDAVENIDEIIEESDGLMVARGDLGIEVPYYEVPAIQKTLIRKANEMSRPVITATQMLLSMTHSTSATRAEISDVANAVLDGTDAVMLSEESAVGENPVLSVETMVNTIRQIETIYPYNKFDCFEHKDETDMIDESTIRLAANLEVDGILCATTSGQSAKKLSRYRPEMTIYAITHDDATARSLCMMWGVVPAFMVKKGSLGQMMSTVVQNGLQRKVLDKELVYILTAGDPIGVPGTTNTIRILRRHEIEFFEKLELKKSSSKKREEPAAATLF